MKKIVLVLLVLPHILHGQSVDSLISMAIQHNPGLKATALEYEAALYVADQVDDFPDPSVNFGVGLLPVQTRLGPQVVKMGVQQALPQKGILDQRRSLAKSRAEVKASLDDLQILDIDYNIRIAYAQLVQISRQQNILNKKLVVLDGLEELAKSNLRAGKGNLSDNLLIERNRMEIDDQKELLEKQKEGFTIMINRWINRPLLSDVILIDTIINDQNIMAEINFENHPRIAWFQQQKQVSMDEVALSQIEEKPVIKLGLDYALVTARDDVEIPKNGRDILMPMGSINIPINTSKYRAKRQEEAIRMQSIDEKINDTKIAFEAAVSTAISEIEYAEIAADKIIRLQNITGEVIKLRRSEYASEGSRLEELLRLEMDLLEYDIKLSNMDLKKAISIARLRAFNSNTLK